MTLLSFGSGDIPIIDPADPERKRVLFWVRLQIIDLPADVVVHGIDLRFGRAGRGSLHDAVARLWPRPVAPEGA